MTNDQYPWRKAMRIFGDMAIRLRYAWRLTGSLGCLKLEGRCTMAKAVKPIPEGHHSVTPYLVVRGASQAIEFYKKAFGAVDKARMPGPDGKSIMHAELKIGDSFIYLSDELPGGSCRSP